MPHQPHARWDATAVVTVALTLAVVIVGVGMLGPVTFFRGLAYAWALAIVTTAAFAAACHLLDAARRRRRPRHMSLK